MKKYYSVFKIKTASSSKNKWVVRIEEYIDRLDLFYLCEYASIVKGYYNKNGNYNEFLFDSENSVDMFCGAIIFYFKDYKLFNQNRNGVNETYIKIPSKFNEKSNETSIKLVYDPINNHYFNSPHTIIALIRYQDEIFITYHEFNESELLQFFDWFEIDIPYYMFLNKKNEYFKILEIRFDLTSSIENYKEIVSSIMKEYCEASTYVIIPSLELSKYLYKLTMKAIKDQSIKFEQIYKQNLRKVSALINQSKAYEIIGNILLNKIHIVTLERYKILKLSDISEEERCITLILKNFILYLKNHNRIEEFYFHAKFKFYILLIGLIYEVFKEHPYLKYSECESVIKDSEKKLKQNMLEELNEILEEGYQYPVENRLKIILKKLLETYNIDLLKDVRFINILDDLHLFCNNNQDLKVILRIAIQKNSLHRFSKIGELNEEAKKFISYFALYNGFREDRVYMVFNSLAFGLGWETGKSSRKHSTPIVDEISKWSDKMSEDETDEFFLSITEYDNSKEKLLGVSMSNLGFSVEFGVTLSITCEIKHIKETEIRWPSLHYGIFNHKGRAKETGQIGYFTNSELGSKVVNTKIWDIKPQNIGRIKLFWK